jgi:hypothetical protein
MRLLSFTLAAAFAATATAAGGGGTVSSAITAGGGGGAAAASASSGGNPAARSAFIAGRAAQRGPSRRGPGEFPATAAGGGLAGAGPVAGQPVADAMMPPVQPGGAGRRLAAALAAALA